MRKVAIKITTLLLFATFFTVVTSSDSYAATYTVINTNDAGAGSLRQAITDANGNGGADTIEFAIPISDPNYNATYGWFKISVTGYLPDITEEVHIDGFSQAINIGDTNSGTIGGSVSAGNLGYQLSPIQKPEIVLHPATGSFIEYGLYLNGANNSIIEGLAIYGFGNSSGSGGGNTARGSIRLTVVQDVTIRYNVLGTEPIDFSSGPSDFASTSNQVSGSGNVSGLHVHNNLMGYSDFSGVTLINNVTSVPVSGVVIEENQFRDLGGLNSTNPIEIQNRYLTFEATIARNYLISSKGDPQLDIIGANNAGVPSVTTINCYENSILTSSNEHQSPTGIRLWGVQSSSISNNIITGNHARGILVITSLASSAASTGSYFNTISQNTFGSNDMISIDLCNNCFSVPSQGGISLNDGYDNDVGNQGMDFPVFSIVDIINDEWLYVEGTAEPNSVVELYRAVADPDGGDELSGDGYGEGVEYLATVTADGSGMINDAIDLSSINISEGEFMSSTATDSLGNTSEFGLNVPVTSGTANIGVAKRLESVTNTAENIFELHFEITVVNLGNRAVTLTTVTDDLSPIASEVAALDLVSLQSSSGTVNPDYDGISDTNMLDSALNLAPAGSATFDLLIRVTADENVTLSNRASALASVYSAISLSDDSDNGSVADADGDAVADEEGENDPTVFSLSVLAETGLNVLGIVSTFAVVGLAFASASSAYIRISRRSY